MQNAAEKSGSQRFDLVTNIVVKRSYFSKRMDAGGHIFPAILLFTSGSNKEQELCSLEDGAMTIQYRG